MRLARLSALAAAAAVLLCSPAFGADKKKKKKEKEREEVTQVLELPKDPPQAVVAEAGRLVFHVSPLSNKGLLSQQVRDALKALFGQVRGAQMVKLRAFVAGSGDVRRVQAIVSEVFTDRRLPIPALSVAQVGALPLEGAQVIIESIAVEKKEVNPGGLVFLSGRPSPAKDAAANLGNALGKAGVGLAGLRQLTCYLDSLDRLNDMRGLIAASFPKAVATYVQIRRDSAGDSAVCEGVGSLGTAPQKSPSFLAAGGPFAEAAMVGPVRLALTGTQMAFGREDADVKLAFDRLGKALESVGANWSSLAALDSYPLYSSIAPKVAAVGQSVFDKSNPPANTMLVFEGLPSLDALLGIDAVAVVAR